MLIQHRTDGIVFKAAIAIGFGFTRSVYVEDGHTMLSVDRKRLEDWIKENGIVEAMCNEVSINMSGRGFVETGFINGMMWIIVKEDGHFFQFYTHDMSHVRREMLRQRTARAVAKAAPDPKTPKRTMKTRGDTL